VRVLNREYSPIGAGFFAHPARWNHSQPALVPRLLSLRNMRTGVLTGEVTPLASTP
jgi:hypothetical protein